MTRPSSLGRSTMTFDEAEHVVLEIANTLTFARRDGDSADEPEGMRRIVMSDTLARKYTEALYGVVEMLRDYK